MANSLRAALLFSILILIGYACNAQVPNIISQKQTYPYYQYYGYIESDSGLLFASRDTNRILIKSGLTSWVHSGDSSLYYFNTQRWYKLISAADTVGLGLHVTFQQSLNNGHILTKTDTVEARGHNFLWDSVGTFSVIGDAIGIGTNAPTTPLNVTVKTRFDVPDASTTTFNKIGNVTDIAGADNLNSFILYNNINSPSTAEFYGAALSGQVTLRIHNTQDTFYTQSVNDGATVALISSFRNGATNDTSAKVISHFGYGNTSYYTNGRNTLVSDFHAGSTDSTLSTDTVTKWRINMPTGSIFTKVTIPDRGVLQEYSDVTIGLTSFTDTTHSNSSFLVKRHNGLNILTIDNTNTDTSYAIYQQGGNDSIYLHASHIRTDNLPSGSPTTVIGIDANGRWLTGTMSSSSHNFGTPSYFTPADAGTVTSTVGINVIEPSGSLSTLTINLPSSPTDGDIAGFSFTQAVSAITVSNGTVVNTITTTGAGGTAGWIFRGTNSKWYKIW